MVYCKALNRMGVDSFHNSPEDSMPNWALGSLSERRSTTGHDNM